MSKGARSARRARYARSGLLVGASVSAIVTFSAVAAAEDNGKWAPYVATGGQVGDQGSTGAKLIGFTPLWQDLNSLAYLRIGVGSMTRTGTIGNLGIGFRTKLNNEWMAGFYGGFDSTRTNAGNTFTQGSLGAELMSADWDARLNGYLAQSKPRDTGGVSGNGLFIQDTRIAILHGQDQPYSGFDGEVGYRVFNTDNIDVRVLAGGFNFTAPARSFLSGGQSFQVNPGNMSGPQGRAEIDLYNINLFGRNARMTFTGRVSHDDVRGTSGFVGALLQVPLGDGDQSEDGDPLDRRMVDPVRRQDYVLTENGERPEQVIIYNDKIASQATNTLYYVDNSTGAGTYADPTTFHDATARGPHNQFIVLTDGEGNVNASGVTVQGGETVVGPGTFKIRGAQSGEVFTHTFAPGSGPVTVNTTDGITLQSHVSLDGFSITGAFANAAIYGHNVDDVHIANVNIHGTGAAANGIYFHQDNGSSAEDITVKGGIINGVTQDGIKLNIQNAAGTTALQHFDLSNLIVTAGQDGIQLTTGVSGGAHETAYLGVHDSTIAGGTTDIDASSTVGAGSSLTQNVLVDPTHLTGGVYGINIHATVDGGSLTQHIELDQVYITGVTGTGINVIGTATGGGSLTQYVDMHTVTSTGTVAFFAGAYANGGDVTQYIYGHGGLAFTGQLGADVTATNGSAYQDIGLGDVAFNAAGTGLDLEVDAGAGGTASQFLDLNNTAASGGTLSYIYAGAFGHDGGSARQNISLGNLHATVAGRLGVVAYANNNGYAYQSVYIDRATLVGDIYISSYAANHSAAHQRVGLSQTQLALAAKSFLADLYADATSHGDQNIYLRNTAATGGSFTTIEITGVALGPGDSYQYVTLANLNATADALYVSGTKTGAGTLYQRADIDHLTVNGTGSYNVSIHGSADTGALDQRIDLSYVYASGGVTDGMVFAGEATNLGQLYQSIELYHVSASGGVYPFHFASQAAGGATATQYLTAYYISATNGAESNIFLHGYSGGGGTEHQYAYMRDVVATGARYGVDAYAGAYDGGTTLQHVNLYNLTATGNALDGVHMVALAANLTPGASAVTGQYVQIRNSDISNNDYGIYARASGVFDSVTRQDLLISGSTINDNATVGVFVEGAAAFYGSVQQYVGLRADEISYNGVGGGVAVYASAGFFGSIQQTVYAAFDYVNANGGDGIAVGAYALLAGQVLQNVSLYDIDAYGNGGDGLRISSSAYGYAIGSAAVYYSHVSQNLIAEFSTFSYNARNGVEIQNYAGYGAQLNQYVYLFGDGMDHNGPALPGPSEGNGLYVHSVADAYGHGGGAIQTSLYSDIYVINGNALQNAVDGLRFKGDANGPTYLIQHIYAEDVLAENNGRSGFVAYASAENLLSFNAQYITLANSYFFDNTLDGAAFLGYQSYGPGSFGAAIQDVTISASYFGGNGRDGLYTSAIATGNQGRDEQHFTISTSEFNQNGAAGAAFLTNAHDGVYVSGYDCGQIQGLTGGCAFVRETILIGYSSFIGNTGNGVSVVNQADNYGAVYGSTGRPVGPTLVVAYSTVRGNGNDGVYVKNTAGTNSYIYSAFLGLASDFSQNVGHGVEIRSDAGVGSLLRQEAILYGVSGLAPTTVYFNHRDGLHVVSSATGGTVQQYVGIYDTYVSFNRGAGVSVYADAGNPGAGTSVVAQYIYVDSSQIFDSLGRGIVVHGHADGAGSITQQKTGIYGSIIHSNNAGGVYAFEGAYNGAAADQTITLESDTIQFNGGFGVAAESTANSQAATQQTLNFDPHPLYISDISHNSNSGIYASVFASSGATALQNVFLYYVNAHDNDQSGLRVVSSAGGYGFGPAYLYHSHVQQNVVAAFDAFDNNGNGGVVIGNSLNYGGATDQTLVFYAVDMNGNSGAGFYERTDLDSIRGHSYSFGTDITSDLTLTSVTANHNGAGGIDIRSYAVGAVYAPAFFGGYNYMRFHNTLSNVTADYNGGAGLNMMATTRGRYTLNAQYNTIAASEFDHNVTTGASFISTDYYGPGGFGVSLQQTSITGSDFSHNLSDGLYLASNASGNQGRAEQHFTITNTNMYYNQGDGLTIHASATNGVYVAGHPCDTVQGLPGGCAFVRQDLKVYGGGMYGNNGNGISVLTYANRYGAIYGVSGRPQVPTVVLNGVTVDGNGGRGLYVHNDASNHSYVFQYNGMIDTTFDHNASDGVYTTSLVSGESVMYQLNRMRDVSTTASSSFNGGSGFKTTIRVDGGSYSQSGSYLEGVNLDHDGGFGFESTISYADGTSGAYQINRIYGNSITHNLEGTGVYASGAGAHQASYFAGDTITYSGLVGMYGKSDLGAYQYVVIDTSTVDRNGTDGLFNASGGASQVVLITDSSFSRSYNSGLTFNATGGEQLIGIHNSTFDHNAANGLVLNATASGAYGLSVQYVSIGGSTFDDNSGSGIHVIASAHDGIYVAGHPCDTDQTAGGCAVVVQSVLISDGSISHNGGDGVYVETYANHYGAIYGVSGGPPTPTMGLYGVTVDYNHGRGLNVSNHVTGGSYLYQYNSPVDTTLDHNSSDGMYLSSYVGGASSMFLHNYVYSYHSGTSISNNGGNGFKSTIEALGGSYIHNVNELIGATLDHNGGFGFDGAVAYADAASNALQQNYVYFNSISHNGDGAGVYAIGVGANQFSYFANNTIAYNTFVGAYGESNFGSHQYIGIYFLGATPAGNSVHDNGTNYLFNQFGGSTQTVH